MNARGAVELIVADIALAAGLFSRPEPVPPVVGSMYSAVVVTAIATTFVTPIGLKALLGEAEGADEDEDGDSDGDPLEAPPWLPIAGRGPADSAGQLSEMASTVPSRSSSGSR